MSHIEIPGFEIIEQIGAGGMATVWKARQLSLDRIVAIKILYSKYSYDPEGLTQFQAEAQAAAKLKHPGIVQVYDASATESFYFFVMEYVSGYTAGEWLRRRGSLKERDAMLVAECVATALQYAWETEQIIHCDIKPDNILIDADGSVKVSDLGLARTLTAMGLEEDRDDVMGTPPYMSPEQVKGEGELDFRADIYSLGATLYHLLTGTMPFEGHDPESIMALQLTGTIPDLIDVNPEVSRPACWLVAQMMAKAPDVRQASWAQVLEDIGRVKNRTRPRGRGLADGISTVKCSASRRQLNYRHVELWRRPSRAPVRIALVAVLLVALVGVGFVILFREHGQNRARNQRTNGPRVREADAGRPGGSEQEQQRIRARERFRGVEAWIQRNPQAFKEGMARLQPFADGRDADLAMRARRRMRELASAARAEQIRSTLNDLEQDALALAEQGDFLAAADGLDAYRGVFAAETAAERQRLAATFREQHEAQEETEALKVPTPEETVSGEGPDVAVDPEALIGEAVHRLFTQGAHAAQRYLLDAEWSRNGLRNDRVGRVHNLMRELAGVDRRILDSFAAQVGQEIEIYMKAGPRRFVIAGVVGGRVQARQTAAGGDTAIAFAVKDLSYRERLRRLGNARDPVTQLARGMMAVEAKAYGFARQFLAEADPELRPYLLKELDRIQAP